MPPPKVFSLSCPLTGSKRMPWAGAARSPREAVRPSRALQREAAPVSRGLPVAARLSRGLRVAAPAWRGPGRRRRSCVSRRRRLPRRRVPCGWLCRGCVPCSGRLRLCGAATGRLRCRRVSCRRLCGGCMPRWWRRCRGGHGRRVAPCDRFLFRLTPREAPLEDDLDGGAAAHARADTIERGEIGIWRVAGRALLRAGFEPRGRGAQAVTVVGWQPRRGREQGSNVASRFRGGLRERRCIPRLGRLRGVAQAVDGLLVRLRRLGPRLGRGLGGRRLRCRRRGRRLGP